MLRSSVSVLAVTHSRSTRATISAMGSLLPNARELRLQLTRESYRMFSGLRALAPRVHTLAISGSEHSISVGRLYSLLCAAPASCGIVRARSEIDQRHHGMTAWTPASPRCGGRFFELTVTSPRWSSAIVFQILRCIIDEGESFRYVPRLTVLFFIERGHRHTSSNLRWSIFVASCRTQHDRTGEVDGTSCARAQSSMHWLAR